MGIKRGSIILLLILGCSSGNNGAQGPKGDPGAPGQSPGTIKFCVGQTTSYPTSFPEYGLCIGNQLYGVYWDGRNAWLALIPPGTYRSTSTGLQCTFTVSQGCQIAPN